MFCRIKGFDLKPLNKKRTLSYFHRVGSEPLRPLTLGKLLEQAARDHGGQYAIVSRHQNKRLTYSDVLDQADRLAAGLIRTGLKDGDRVGLWSQNFIEWYISFFACARAGFLTVTINPAYEHTELEYCANKVGIKSIICGHKFREQKYYDIIAQICPELPISEPGKLSSKSVPSLESVITFSDETLRGTYNYNEVLDLADPSSIDLVKSNQDKIGIDDPTNIQLTSGTTGQPKATVISHFGMVNSGFYTGKRNELDTQYHRICVQVPLFHAYGTSAISTSMNYGATLVLPCAGFDAHRSLDAIKEENCTIIYGTPTMYEDLVLVQKEKKERISPDIALIGAAPCSPFLFKDMLEVLCVKKVNVGYGLSETTGPVFQAMTDDDHYKSTSTVGLIQEHLEAKVIDSDGKIVPNGTPGELCIRGYLTMLGYWDEDEKTKEMVGPDRWLRTGDQFILDENGYGSIVGRLKEMIIRGGENIFPKEIEDFLNTHPHILESHVIGLPHERLGEEVCACVKLQEGHSVTLEEIRDFCKGNISYFKIPSVLVIVTTIPRTLVGKVQKFKLKEQALKEKLNK